MPQFFLTHTMLFFIIGFTSFALVSRTKGQERAAKLAGLASLESLLALAAVLWLSND